MSILEKYWIAGLVSDGETRTFRAQQTSTGRAVLVHQLKSAATIPNQPDLTSLVFKYLRSPSAIESEHFLDFEDDANRVFVVTADVPECLNLREWLQSLAAGQENRGGRGPVGKPFEGGTDSTPIYSGSPTDGLPEGDPSLGATVVVPSLNTGWARPTAPGSGKDQGPLGTPQAPPKDKHEPGSFTKAFQAPQPRSGAEEAPTPPWGAPTAQVRDREGAPSTMPGLATGKDGPGEFTRMFSAPAMVTKPPESPMTKGDASIPSPQPAAPPAPRETADKSPGAFTMMFFSDDKDAQKLASPSSSPSPETKQEPAVKTPAKPSRGQVPSGFQVVFQSRKTPRPAASPQALPRSMPVAAPEPKAEPAGLGEFTQMFSGLGKGDLEKPREASPPPASSATKGPGEFTQMFHAGELTSPKAQQPAPGARQAPPPPPVAPPKPAAPPPASSAEKQPGEFTQMFHAGELTSPKAQQPAPRASQAPPPPPVAPPKPAAPPPASSAKKESGEFTQMFHAGELTSPEAQQPAPRASQAPTASLKPPTSADQPGMATQFPHAPLSPKPPGEVGARGPAQEPPVSPVSSTEPRGPSEFTQLFMTGGEKVGGTRSPVPSGPSQPTSPLSSSSAQKGSGEFTQMMQAYKPPKESPAAPVIEPPKPSSPAPATAPGKSAPGEITMMFRQPPQPVAPAPTAAAPPPVAQSAPPPPQPQGPGEYTRIFELPPRAATPSLQGAPQAPVAAQPPAGYGLTPMPVAPPMQPMVPQPPYAQVPMAQPPAYPVPPLPQPMVPQPPYLQVPMAQPPAYQVPPLQYPQPVPPTYAMAPPPAMPQMRPMAIPPPAVPQASPAGAGKKAIFLVAILLGGLFIVAVALILFFALRH